MEGPLFLGRLRALQVERMEWGSGNLCKVSMLCDVALDPTSKLIYHDARYLDLGTFSKVLTALGQAHVSQVCGVHMCNCWGSMTQSVRFFLLTTPFFMQVSGLEPLGSQVQLWQPKCVPHIS